jgi:hypothetical protein
MRAVVRVGTALARSGALRTVAGRGLDMVAQVSDTAAEVMRSRRDASLVAARRRRAARRRVTAWSLGALLFAAIGATGVVQMASDGMNAGAVGALVLMVGLLVYCLVGVVRGSIDLRARTKVVRRLPAPQPPRRPVGSAIRNQIARLDGYSDALRQTTGMIGVVQDDPGIRRLRDETLAAADAAEVRLRAQAAELTSLLRGGRPPAGSQLAAACASLKAQIVAGVDEYGRLVAAASEAASASRALAASTSPAGGVAEVTGQLAALAAGMRELTEMATPQV